MLSSLSLPKRENWLQIDMFKSTGIFLLAILLLLTLLTTSFFGLNFWSRLF